MRARRVAKRLSRNFVEKNVWDVKFIETPQPLRMVFALCANPRPNCRLERTAYETTALSASPIVRDILSYLFCIIFVNLTFPIHARSGLSLWDDNQDRIHSTGKKRISTDLCEPKYNMTCEARYFWDSREAHFRVETTIKMKYTQTEPNQNIYRFARTKI